jgi:hypothetical protein
MNRPFIEIDGRFNDQNGPFVEIDGRFDDKNVPFDEIDGRFNDLGDPSCSHGGPPRDHGRPLTDEKGEFIDKNDSSHSHAAAFVEVIETLDDAEVLHDRTSLARSTCAARTCSGHPAAAGV